MQREGDVKIPLGSSRRHWQISSVCILSLLWTRAGIFPAKMPAFPASARPVVLHWPSAPLNELVKDSVL